jgi:hypothetical protein
MELVKWLLAYIIATYDERFDHKPSCLNNMIDELRKNGIDLVSWFANRKRDSCHSTLPPLNLVFQCSGECPASEMFLVVYFVILSGRKFKVSFVDDCYADPEKQDEAESCVLNVLTHADNHVKSKINDHLAYITYEFFKSFGEAADHFRRKRETIDIMIGMNWQVTNCARDVHSLLSKKRKVRKDLKDLATSFSAKDVLAFTSQCHPNNAMPVVTVGVNAMIPFGGDDDDDDQ